MCKDCGAQYRASSSDRTGPSFLVEAGAMQSLRCFDCPFHHIDQNRTSPTQHPAEDAVTVHEAVLQRRAYVPDQEDRQSNRRPFVDRHKQILQRL